MISFKSSLIISATNALPAALEFSKFFRLIQLYLTFEDSLENSIAFATIEFSETWSLLISPAVDAMTIGASGNLYLRKLL